MNTTCEESKCGRDVSAREREDIIGEQQEENSLTKLEALQKFHPFTPPPVSADSVLPRRKLRTVVEYIMENLEGSPTLEQMAAVARLSPYHFARQFKASTGLAPHQYLISCRIERAQHLLRAHGELGLAEVALRVGFSDQSQFSRHFKRILGVTPKQFHISARTR